MSPKKPADGRRHNAWQQRITTLIFSDDCGNNAEKAAYVAAELARFLCCQRGGGATNAVALAPQPPLQVTRIIQTETGAGCLCRYVCRYSVC